jgi:hypothetical protein
MSFMQEFIETVRLNTQAFEANGHRILPAQEYPRHALEIAMFDGLCQTMADSTIIRLRGDQSEIFLETPIDEHQDFIQWLRLPYPNIYIQLEQPFRFHGYAADSEAIKRDIQHAKTDEERNRLLTLSEHGDPIVRGAVITDITTSMQADLRLGPDQTIIGKLSPVRDTDGFLNFNVEEWAKLGLIDFPADRAARIIHVVFLMPIPEFFMNIHSFTLTVTRDNQLYCARHTSQQATLIRAKQWLVHLVNFLSSPTVKLVRNQPDAALQKARQKRGKDPLPGWYEITYRRHLTEYSKGKISAQGWHHKFRYDVRGHFRRYESGPATGRVVWIAPHQRGIHNTLYRPKGYREQEAR